MRCVDSGFASSDWKLTGLAEQLCKLVEHFILPNYLQKLLQNVIIEQMDYPVELLNKTHFHSGDTLVTEEERHSGHVLGSFLHVGSVEAVRHTPGTQFNRKNLARVLA